jgi:hypothetical protein
MKRPQRRKASESKALLREAVVGGVLSTCCPAGIPIHKAKRINLPQSVESVQSKIYEVPARKRLIIERRSRRRAIRIGPPFTAPTACRAQWAQSGRLTTAELMTG